MGLYKEDVLPFHFQRLQASVLADADQCLVQVQPKRRQIPAVQTYALNISLLHYMTLENFLRLCYIICVCQLKTVVINCKKLHGPESF